MYFEYLPVVRETLSVVDLLGGVDFPTGESAVGGPGVLLASLDRADYLPPPAAAVAPTDAGSQHMSIGHPSENAG